MAKVLRRPEPWHYLLLAAGGLFIALCARHQWFFFDEWAFLVPSGPTNLLAPHVGHWSTGPMLLTHALQGMFGLRSYAPYVGLAIAIHLGIAHLLWRILRRVGVQEWVAVALAFFFTVLGAGAQNILWGFQIGFMGAILLGLGALLVVDVAEPRHPALAYAGFVVLSVTSLAFAGTALPLLAAAAVLAWRRRGWRRAALLLAPSVVIYAAWYLYAATAFVQAPAGRAETVEQLLTAVPQYAATMFVDALQAITPIPLFGIVLFTVVLLVVAARFTALWRTRPLALATTLAAVAFALLTGFSRVNLGIPEAGAGRYVYYMVALMLPVLGVAATAAIRRRALLPALAVLVIAAAAVYNAGLLRVDSLEQASREQGSRAIISAAAAALSDPALTVPPDAQPEPQYAPDLTAADLRMLLEEGQFVPGPYTPDDYETARKNLQR